MAPYRAGGGGGAFGSHAYPDSRPQIDAASAIDAFTDGASTLIRQAYQRRMASVELERQNQAVAYQRQRDQVADKRADDEMVYRRGRDAAQDAEKAIGDRRSAIERGFTPEHTEQSMVPTTTPAPGAPRSAVRAAMTAPTKAGELPPPQMTPVAPPAAAPIQGYEASTTTVPETFDPKKSAKFAIADERANDQATRDLARQQNQIALKKLGGELATSLAKLKASLAKDVKSTAGKAMTANKLEEGRTNAAIGLVDFTKGSLDDAIAYLSSEDGAKLRELGVEPHHLMFARSKYADAGTRAAMPLQTGRYGMDPASAAAAVSTTRAAVTPGKPEPGAPTGMASLRRPGGAAAAAAANPVNRSAAPDGKPKASDGKAKPPADDYSETELADAFDAGKTTDDDIRAFIVAQRKTKKKPPAK